MTLPRRQVLGLAVSAIGFSAVPRIARAQAYPTRPVRLIVGAPPGGPNDVHARLIGQWLSERLGQPFIIENRAGAGTNLGTEVVVRAPADGYTLLLPVHRTQSTQRSTTISTLISCATLHRSQACRVDGLSWRSIRRFRPRPFPSLLAMPKQIRTRSAWHRLAMGLLSTWPANCSR